MEKGREKNSEGISAAIPKTWKATSLKQPVENIESRRQYSHCLNISRRIPPYVADYFKLV